MKEVIHIVPQKVLPERNTRAESRTKIFQYNVGGTNKAGKSESRRTSNLSA